MAAILFSEMLWSFEMQKKKSVFSELLLKNFEMAIVILPRNDDLKLTINNFKKFLRDSRSKDCEVRVERYYCSIN